MEDFHGFRLGFLLSLRSSAETRPSQPAGLGVSDGDGDGEGDGDGDGFPARWGSRRALTSALREIRCYEAPVATASSPAP
jgi:hypothetical protein